MTSIKTLKQTPCESVSPAPTYILWMPPALWLWCMSPLLCAWTQSPRGLPHTYNISNLRYKERLLSSVCM